MNTKIIQSPEQIKILKWLSKALSTDSNRAIINCLHVSTDGQAVATDGKRLHVAKEGLSIEPGNYRLRVSKNEAILTSEDGTYPDWGQIIPSGPEHITFQVKKQDSATNLCARSGVALNYAHLCEALGYGSILTKHKTCGGRMDYKDPISPVKIVLACGTLYSVIMPLRPM